MASFIQGYGYYNFNSHLKDATHKGDHWVTVFANVLKSEPETTFKVAVNDRIK